MSDDPEVHVEALCSKILEKANHYDSLFAKARIQTIRVKTDQKLADLERLRKLKDEHKKLDYDLRMAQFVKTCKYVKLKNTQESISATKARVEELRRIVQKRNAVDGTIEELMPQQLDDVLKFDDTDGRNFEAALLWYRNVLGFRTEGGEGVKFFFSKIDHKNPDKEFSFTIRLEGETYRLLKCDPLLRDTPRLIKELNETHSFFKFVRAMREKFLAYALYEFSPSAEDIYPNPSSTFLSSPSVSDSMSGDLHIERLSII
ncbi:Kinetochore protein Spc25 [Zostera marina]|uniref:Kinetochore protein SPC25 n=1 Tax=Zostera marina TaxID=29655 RepID=A0A0K9PPE3_ZOSMR|nr:Kinetochore protein Spc25 [Zostera marina]